MQLVDILKIVIVVLLGLMIALKIIGAVRHKIAMKKVKVNIENELATAPELSDLSSANLDLNDPEQIKSVLANMPWLLKMMEQQGSAKAEKTDKGGIS